MKHISLFALLLLLLLPGCDQQVSLQDIENHVRTEVLSEKAGIATLQAVYLVTYMNYEKNRILSDDNYIQKDKICVDYGFDIENAIKVVADGPRKILQVRLGKGRIFAEDRTTIDRQTTHEGYVPAGENGLNLDIDAVINKEFDAEKARYEEANLKLAADNIRNFFKVLAAKYKLELDFQIDG